MLHAPPPPPPPPHTHTHTHYIAGESLDEMKLLEEQARRIAEEAREDHPQTKTMSFVKSVHSLLLFSASIL